AEVIVGPWPARPAMSTRRMATRRTRTTPCRRVFFIQSICRDSWMVPRGASAKCRLRMVEVVVCRVRALEFLAHDGSGRGRREAAHRVQALDERRLVEHARSAVVRGKLDPGNRI